MWHAAPESVSNLLREGIGERAILCGGPTRNIIFGAKEAGCASLNDLQVDQQAITSGLDSESLWTTFPTYSYDKGKGSTCSIKLDVHGTAHVDFIRLWVPASLMAIFSDDIRWPRVLESTRLKDRVSLFCKIRMRNGINSSLLGGWLDGQCPTHDQ